MKYFPYNFKTIRQRKGWTQEQVARELTEHSGTEISVSTIKHWELGNRRPTVDILPAIAEVLGIDDLYLFLSKSIVTQCNHVS